MKRLLFIFVLITLFNYDSAAQIQNLDSLWRIIKTASHDTTRFNALMEAGTSLQNSDPDSAIYFHYQACKLADKINDPIKKGNALRQIGWDNFILGNNDTAFVLFTEVVTISDKILKNEKNKVKIIQAKKLLASAYGNIGVIFNNKGDYTNALDYYFRSLKINEELNNRSGEAINLGNIGILYKEQHLASKAMQYYSRALKIFEEIGHKQGQAVNLGNIGLSLKEQGDSLVDRGNKRLALADKYPKALDFYFKALKINEEIGNKLGQAANLGNIGGLYHSLSNDTKALEFFLRSLAINNEIGNKRNQALDMGSIGVVYFRAKKYSLAEKYFLDSYEMAKQSGSLYEVKQAHQNLFKLYESTARPALALKHYDLFIEISDSLIKEENAKAAIQQEMKFNFEKKATADSVKTAEEKKILNAKLSANNAKLEQEKTQRLVLFGGLALLTIFAGFMVNRFRVTNRQKKLIEKQNKIVEEQKSIVEEKQKEILDSIHYAKRIQTALLPHEKFIDRTISKLSGKI